MGNNKSIYIEGNNTGVIITGDNNSVNLAPHIIPNFLTLVALSCRV